MKSDDVKLMKTLGVKAYRFSIAWPRVFPEGAGSPNPKGLDFYNRLLDELLANGIEPFATLYHWDLPRGFAWIASAGWLAWCDTSKAFADYAGYVAERLSDRQEAGIPRSMNAPGLFNRGYGAGFDAPGLGVTWQKQS